MRGGTLGLDTLGEDEEEGRKKKMLFLVHHDTTTELSTYFRERSIGGCGKEGKK